MSRLRPKTLLWQLGVTLIVVQAVVLIGLSIFGLNGLRQVYLRQTLQELERIHPVISEQYHLLLQTSGRDDEIDQLTKRDGRRTGLRISVMRPDGEVIGDSRGDPRVIPNHRNREEVLSTIETGSGSAIRVSATVGEGMVYYAGRVQAGAAEGDYVILRVAKPITDVEQQIGRIVRVIFPAGLVAFGLTVVFIYFISRHLSRNVSTLADSAGRFAEGDLSHRIDPPASSELRRLADALNAMARRLNEQIQQLQTQRNEQRIILESMSNGVMALDLDQRILSLNQAAERILGISGDAARGRLLQEVLRQPGLNQFVARAMAEPGHSNDEFTLDGDRYATIQGSSESLRDSQNRPVGVLLLLNDVTQLRRLESLRSDFAANVSHELRTPITNIKGYVETLLDVGTGDQPQTQRFLETIKRNSDRLAAIIEDLLALARLEQPDTRETLEMKPVRIEAVVQSVMRTLESVAEAKKIAMEVSVADALTLDGNGQLIEQALTNLVSNAIKYSPGGTAVRVEVRPVADDVVFSVTDQGPGIAAHHLPRLFERFYRVDKARSREVGGTGLGLAIVKHIALVHDGRCEVDTKVGRGSTFRLIIPAHRHASS